ncbi:hypothetical protein N0V84_000925 [Fusarium piperis]|uniref:Uncharacterized protein n=1 Tax=Fusarium piperis TaxID=1435070 RepID=A0A9W9BUQ6_9HYPO|nr:hypothetical protein N0V84_000925 [Fusarium piperis]
MVILPAILVTAASVLVGLAGWYFVYDTQRIEHAEKHITEICQIHHRLLTTYPTKEPTTFFQHLGLNHSEAPFSDPRWLILGEAANDKARGAINQKWAERGKRLLDSALESEEEHALNFRVVDAMHNHQLMAAYVDLFMPELVKGQGGLKRLKKVCGEKWKEEK